MGKRKRSGSWSKGDDYGAKRSDDCDSQEELDGDSTVAKSSSSSTINVRCSARVQEKQEKLRREASPSKLCPHDGICVISSGPSSSNSTVMCKVKNNNNNNNNPSDDVILTGSVGDDPGAVGLGGNNEVGSGSDGKRKKRTWELWSQYDKQLFFEALNEFGKDFDAIQTHLASKLKSKNKTVEPTQIKKKEQVRHFYYRTWNKIQKYLHFPKDMKKAFQELYGLVNYGELRKKQRSLNGKTAAKLLELVEKGSTTIKVKGKTLRIKTPVCQALKKINNLTDVEPTKVPTKVVVELLPKDGSAWSVVQSLSHNPRVRTLVLLQRTLASIISYLEERWKSSQDRIKEQMMAAFGKNSARRLRLIPASRRDSTVPIFKAYETASSAKISLNSFSRNVLNKDSTSYVKLVEKRKRKKSGSVGGCGGGVEAATDSVAEVDWSDAEMGSETQLPLPPITYTSPGAAASSLTPGSSTTSAGVGASSPAVASSGPSAGCSSGSLIGGSSGSLAGSCSSIAGGSYSSLATKLFRNAFGDDTLEVKGMAQEELQRMLQSIYDLPRLNNNAQEDEDFENGDGDLCPDSDDYQKLSGCCCHPVENNVGEPEEVFSTRIEDEILKKGWTADEAGSLTVGEVYMLVGHDDKLSFEYEWVEGEEDNEANARTRIMLDRLISVARNLKKKKQSRHKLSSAGSCPSCGHNISTNSSESAVSSFPPPAPTLLPYRTPHSPGLIASKSSTNTPNNSSSNNNNNNKTTPPPTNTVPVQSASLSPSTTISTTVASIFEDTATSTGGILSTTCSTSTSIESETKVTTTTTTKKITPTLVSPSCTGATMLTTLPTLLSKPEEILQSSTPQIVSTCSTSKESKEDTTTTTTFRVPNGTHSPLIYPRIRPMPSDPEDSSTSPSSSSSSVKNVNFKNAPKPFLDLPKGNRRLGRPCCKKNIVPRYLPLLPKKVVEPPPQPAVWEIVGNKAAAVHTVYVSSAAQLMLPISIKNPPTTGNPSLVTEEVSSKVESHRDQPEPSNSAECGTNSSTNNAAPDNNSPTGFNHLLKVPPDLEGDKTESNLSLSSFMDISLPESTRNVANECLKSEKFLDVTLGSSSCSLSLSNFLGQSGSSSENLESSGERPTEQSLKTPQKVASGLELIYRTQSPPSNLLSTTENQWLTSDGNDLSLGSLLGNLESGQSGVASENEMNFQSMIEDSNNHLDFTSKFSELVAELESGSSNNNNKK